MESATTTVTGETAGITRSWDTATGFLTGENRYGIQTTFAKDAFGNVSAITDAHGHTTHQTYEWGVVKNTTTPMGFGVTRVINADGTVLSETENGATTTYGYDDFGRLRSVDPPEGDTTFMDFSTDGRFIFVSRGGAGGSLTVQELDGFARIEETSTNVGVFTKTRYDAFGRKEFESLPHSEGLPGTTFVYDALDRVISAQTSDGAATIYHYTAGIDVQITDSENRVTKQDWSAFGDPSDAQLTKVTDAENEQWTYEYNALGRLTSVIQPAGGVRTWQYFRTSDGKLTDLLAVEQHPESGHTSYTYEGGRLASKATPHATLTFEYDANDRLRVIDTPANTAYNVFIDYDNANNRTRLENGFLKSTFEYDSANRLEARKDVLPGQPELVTSYTYDNRDNLASITYPSGREVRYDHDAENRLYKATVFPENIVVGEVTVHHASGAIASLRSGNNIQETFSFHPHRYWPTQIAGGPVQITYGHDTVGNVESVTDARGASFSHPLLDYDLVDRLEVVTGMGAADYTYDALGNRKTKSSVAGTYTYSYNASNRLAQVLGPPPNPEVGSYGHDASGNMTSDPAGTYTYTPFNMMETATVASATTTYRYDGDNIRKIKDSPAGVRYYLHGPANQLLMEYKDVSGTAVVEREYIYLGSRLVASFGDTTPPPPAPPVTVRITHPHAGYRHRSGDDLIVTASATATSGSIQRVEFYANGFLLGSDTSAPYEALWTAVVAGVHRIHARAVTASGQSFQSTPIAFTTFASARIKTLSVSPNPVWEGEQATLTVNGSGACGAVEINWGDGQRETKLDPFPFTATHIWSTPGIKTITARGHGEACDHPPVSTTVEVRSNKPSVSITSPGTDTSFAVGTSIAIAATASDLDGTVTQVEFFAGTVSLGVDTTAPYEVIWNPATHGQYVLTAKATDNSGSFNVSAAVSVEIRRVASVTVSPATPVRGVSATVTVNGTGYCGGVNLDFGDGQQATLLTGSLPASTSHAWMTPGPKTVRALGLGSECPGTVTTTINVLGDSPPSVSFVTAQTTTAETGSVTVHVKVERPGGASLAETVTVQYSTINGAAIAGTDYQSTSGTLQFPSGTASGATLPITVPISPDTLFEADEHFLIDLSTTTALLVLPSIHAVTIADDDVGVHFVETSSDTPESGSATVQVRVTKHGGGSVGAASVQYTTASGTAASGSDFTATSGTISIPAGAPSGTTYPISVPIAADSLSEAHETFTVQLSSTTIPIVSPSTHVVTILDNDFALSADDLDIEEGTTGPVTARVAVRLSAAAPVTVSAQYATANGTALADVGSVWNDYAPRSGTVSFPAGTTVQFIEITVRPEFLSEANEHFFVNLSSPVNAALADTQAIVTIVNDDTPQQRTWGDFSVPPDGAADVGAFNPGGGAVGPQRWWLWTDSVHYSFQLFNNALTAQDLIVSADYTGDGRMDCAAYRPSTGVWFIAPTCQQSGAFQSTLGGVADDVPVPADYDGDDKADLAIFRRATNFWHIILSTTGAPFSVEWGWSGWTHSTPAPGDYDGDGSADTAFYSSFNGVFMIIKSSTGTVSSVGWGIPGETNVIPTPGDYDGDGLTDPAFYYPTDAHWYIVPSSTGVGYSVQFGSVARWLWETPAPADYDNDGKTDLAIYDTEARLMQIRRSSTGQIRHMQSPLAFPGDRSLLVRPR